MIKGSVDNNRRNDYCVCRHSLNKHSDMGCHYAIHRSAAIVLKWCSCRKFRPAKAKEKT